MIVLIGVVVLVLEGGVVVAVAGAVFEAAVVTEEALALLSALCERSIVPIFGVTRAVAASVSAAETALLEPEDPPQAARVNVASVHRRALRIM